MGPNLQILIINLSIKWRELAPPMLKGKIKCCKILYFNICVFQDFKCLELVHHLQFSKALLFEFSNSYLLTGKTGIMLNCCHR